MRIEIKKVHQKVCTTTVHITHDQVEAMTLPDRVVVMNHGGIKQVGSPNELYHHPTTRFVSGFIGSPAMNFIPCRLEDISCALHIRLTDVLVFQLPPSGPPATGRRCMTRVCCWGCGRSTLSTPKSNLEPGVWAFDAVLDVTEPMGMETLMHFTLEGVRFVAGSASMPVPTTAARSDWRWTAAICTC